MDLDAQRTSIYAAIGKRAKIGSLAKHATANSFTWASYSFSEQRGSLLYNSLTKIRSVSHFLQPPAIDKASEVKRKNVCKSKGVKIGAKNKALITSRSFPREIPVLRRFFRHRFQGSKNRPPSGHLRLKNPVWRVKKSF